jgi:hypothetical protein
VQGFSLAASGFTAETDWLLEGAGFELSVPRGTTKVSRQKLNLGVKAVRDESDRWPSACDLKEHRQNKDEGKSALAPQNDSV